MIATSDMTTTTGAVGFTGGRRRPSILSVGLRRARLELKMYFRAKEAVVFNFLFPIMLMVLFGSIFGGEVEGTGVSYKQVLVSGVIAAGVMSVSCPSLAIGVAMERHDGTIKRLAGTPMPKGAYFIGKIGMAFVWGLACLTVVPWERAPWWLSHASTATGLVMVAGLMAASGGTAITRANTLTSGQFKRSSSVLPTYMLAISAHTMAPCFSNISGPGVMSSIIRAPSMTAVAPPPGNPSVSNGTSEAPLAELFADSGQATPRMSPVPRRSGWRHRRFSRL